MKTPLSPRLIDAAWLLLLFTTGTAWLVFDGAITTAHQPALLMALMVVKSGLILAIFMDLIRHSRLMFAGVLAFMLAIGMGIAVQI
jgi:cytochrome c oxidase subunit IV